MSIVMSGHETCKYGKKIERKNSWARECIFSSHRPQKSMKNKRINIKEEKFRILLENWSRYRSEEISPGESTVLTQHWLLFLHATLSCPDMQWPFNKSSRLQNSECFANCFDHFNWSRSRCAAAVFKSQLLTWFWSTVMATRPFIPSLLLALGYWVAGSISTSSPTP